MEIPAKSPPQALSQPSKEDSATFQLSKTKPLQGAQPWHQGLRLQGPPCQARGMSKDLWISTLLLVLVHSSVPVTPGLVGAECLKLTLLFLFQVHQIFPFSPPKVYV